MKRKQAVVFDLGGVVVNWHPERLIAATAADEEMRARVRREIFAHPDWLEHDRGTLEKREAVRRFAGRSGLSEAQVDALLTTVAESLVPNAGTVALMTALHDVGHPLYFLSNMAPTSFDHLERTCDFWRYFSGGVVSCRVRLMKPEAAIYDHLLEQYGLRARNTIFIDDMQANVDAAAALGFTAIRFTDPEQCERDLRSIIVF
jgi:putative hydrolase of the HAD superfamily